MRGLHTFDRCMIALRPDPQTAAALAVEGGLAAQDLHLTLADCGSAHAIDRHLLIEAAAAVTGHAPVQAVITGTVRFTGDEADALCALVEGSALDGLRHQVTAALEHRGVSVVNDHRFVPHITRTYLGPHDPAPIGPLAALPMRFATVSVVHGRFRRDLPFSDHPSAAHAPSPAHSARIHGWPVNRPADSDTRALDHLLGRQLPALAGGAPVPPFCDEGAVTVRTSGLINRVLRDLAELLQRIRPGTAGATPALDAGLIRSAGPNDDPIGTQNRIGTPRRNPGVGDRSPGRDPAIGLTAAGKNPAAIDQRTTLGIGTPSFSYLAAHGGPAVARHSVGGLGE